MTASKHSTLLLAIVCLVALVTTQRPVDSHATATVDYASHPNLQQTFMFNPDAGTSNRFAVQGRYAYVATSSDHIYIIDLHAQTGQDTVQSEIVVPTTLSGDINGLAVHGSHLYVAYLGQQDHVTRHYVDTYDVSDPAAPEVIPSLRFNLWGQTRIAPQVMTRVADGDTIHYVCMDAPGATHALSLYSIDESSGALTYAIGAYDSSSVIELAVSGSYAFASYNELRSPYTPRILGVNFSNMGSPARTNEPEMLGASPWIAVPSSNGIVYAYGSQAGHVEGHLLSGNSFSTSPNVLIDATSVTRDMDCVGPNLIVGDSNNDIHLYDITCKLHPIELDDCCSTTPANAIYMIAIGDTVYTSGDQFRAFAMNHVYDDQEADISGDGGGPVTRDVAVFQCLGGEAPVWYVGKSSGFKIYELASGVPTLATSTTFMSGYNVSGLTISDDQRLLACAGSQVALYDLSADPETPELQTSQAPSYGQAVRAVLLGGRVYMAAGTAGLSVYSVNASNELVHRNTIALTGNGSALDVVMRVAGSDTLAYVATSDASHGVEVFKVRSTAAPQRKGNCAVDDPQRLWLKDSYLYVASGDSGVTVVNVNSADSPTKSAEIRGGNVVDIAAAGSYLYFTDGQVVKVYDIGTPTAPVRKGFVDAYEELVALDVTNRLWVADAQYVRYGPMQTLSVPEVISGSEDMEASVDGETGDVYFTMSWRTKEWVDPSLLYIVVSDDANNGQECQSFGSGTELHYDDSGVSVSVMPDLRGGFKNSVRFYVGECVQMCKYWCTGHIAVNDESGAWATTAQKSCKLQLCPEME